MSNLLVLAKVSYCLLTYFFASYEIVLILPLALLELDHAVEKVIQKVSSEMLLLYITNEFEFGQFMNGKRLLGRVFNTVVGFFQCHK